MAREDKSQTGAREGVASERDGLSARGDGEFRSRVGLDRVADLDREPDVEADDTSEREARTSDVVPAGTPRDATDGAMAHGDGDRADTPNATADGAAPASGMLGSLRRIFDGVRAKAESFAHDHGLGGISLDDRDERIDTREPPVDVIPDGMSPAGAIDGERADPDRSPRRGGAIPTDAEAHAGSGRAGSQQAARKAAARQTGATVRGAASSGEQRGTSTGPRKATRVAGSRSKGTDKPGVRRGSSKSKSAHRAH